MKEEHKTALKAMVFAQAFVETLDDFKGTSHFKQQLKRKGNMFGVELERFLESTYGGGNTDSNILHLMEACQNAIEDIIDKQVELVE
jgi:hypothetical protein|tara:strand:- start:138 stop:398 length:261 start_codon:yes stop_codon:yes gene_type:complete